MVDMIGLAHAVCGIAPETPKVSLADEVSENVARQRVMARRLVRAICDGHDRQAGIYERDLKRTVLEFGRLLERVRELEEGR
jgi:hypothetical protein